MTGAARLAGQASRAASVVLGGTAVAVAATAAVWSRDAADIAQWSLGVLGAGFIALLAALVLLAAFSLVRLIGAERRAESDFWLDVGVHAANGVVTLALTFTLAGVSLGIASLAGQELTPETVRGVIQELTANFSRAFLTTVIGLPVSAVLRSALSIVHGRRWLNQAAGPAARSASCDF